jgi:hypothetical protein
MHSRSLNHIASLLKKDSLKFFTALDKEAFIDLLGIMDIDTCPKGRVILRRDDPDTDVFHHNHRLMRGLSR